MGVRQASAYALRKRPLGEADLIVELFTREYGRIRAVARSARRLRSRYGSAFELFTRSRVVWFQRDKDDLGRLSSCEIERSWFELLADEERAGTAAYMAELLLAFAPEADPAPALFRLIGVVLEALEAGVDLDLTLRYFEVWLLRLSGLYPDLDRCGRCGRHLGTQAWVCESTLEFVCGRTCGGADAHRRLLPEGRDLVRKMVRARPQEWRGVRINPASVRSVGKVNELLIRGHLGRRPRAGRMLERLRRERRRGA